MKGRPWKAWPALALATGLAVVGLAAASLLGLGAPYERPEGVGAEDLATVLEVIGVVKTHYLEPISAVDMLAAYVKAGTVNGMLKEVVRDPYTRYMNPQAYQQFQAETTGHYAGIGIYMGLDREGRLSVVAPIPGTPAAKAGLKAGDLMIEVDGKSTAEMSQDEAASLIRGPRGTPVVLTIERNGKRMKVTVVRDEISAPAVSAVEMLPGRVGYVRLLQFSEDAGPQMDEALTRLELEGYRGLVLDLRDNPGGLLTASVDVASLFFSSGAVVHVVGRSGERHTIEASPLRTHRPVPMVVLVNKGSASASEILAGALQDRGVATLVGTKTFGKGLVQTVVPLSRGDALTVTTQKYQTAGGRYIGNEGIEPDVVVEIPVEEEERLAAARAEGQVDLRDVQLQKALEVLTNEMARMVRATGGG